MRFSKLPTLLGVLGLLPFVAGVVASQSHNGAIAHAGVVLFLAYSFAIFNFLAGSLWGLNLTSTYRSPSNDPQQSIILGKPNKPANNGFSVSLFFRVNKGFLVSNILMLGVFFALALVFFIGHAYLLALISILATGYVLILFSEYQWMWPVHKLSIFYSQLRCWLTLCVVLLHFILVLLLAI